MPINPQELDVVLPPSGYPPEVAAGDTTDAMKGIVVEAGAVITEFPKKWWVEPRDWAAFAREQDKNKGQAINFIGRFTNQDPTHECTCHSLSRNYEGARNRARQIAVGPPVKDQRSEFAAKAGEVWVSPLSIYSEANPRQWGGAGVRQVLGIATKRGFLPDKIQPRDYGFKHYLHGTTGKGNTNQSSGPWVKLSNFPEGWEQTGALLKPVEYIFPDSWEQMVCMVMHGVVTSVGRDGHAVPLSRWMADDEVMAYVDSYNVIRFDSPSRMRRSVDGSFGIVSVVTPDDWDKPAG